MSDFVHPSWFIAASPGPWDYREHCTGPLQLLPGGYIGVWTPGMGWSQATAGGAPRRRNCPRFAMRAKGRGPPGPKEVPAWSGSTLPA